MLKEKIIDNISFIFSKNFLKWGLLCKSEEHKENKYSTKIFFRMLLTNFDISSWKYTRNILLVVWKKQNIMNNFSLKFYPEPTPKTLITLNNFIGNSSNQIKNLLNNLL